MGLVREAGAGPLLTPKISEKSPTIDITGRKCIYEINRFLKELFSLQVTLTSVFFVPIYGFPRNRTMCIEVDLEVK